MRIVGLLGKQIHGIHSHAGVEIIARGIQQELLNMGIAERTACLLRRHSVIFHRDLIGPGSLSDRTDGADGAQRRLCLAGTRPGTLNDRALHYLVSGANPAREADDEDCRRQRWRKSNLVQPVDRIKHQTMPPSALLGGDRKSTRLNSSHEWISYAVFC